MAQNPQFAPSNRAASSLAQDDSYSRPERSAQPATVYAEIRAERERADRRRAAIRGAEQQKRAALRAELKTDGVAHGRVGLAWPSVPRRGGA
jgi:hypothetical protein